MEPVNQNAPQPERASTSRLLFSVIILVVVVVVLYVVASKVFNRGGDYSYESVNISENIGVDRIPEAFPKDIPVNAEAIVDASSSSYKDGRIMQSDVTYLTDVPAEDVILGYKQYFEARGYEVVEDSTITEENDGTIVNKAILYGRKDNADLSILVLPEGEGGASRVNVSYVEKQNS